jgi:hypothetical protein
LAIVHEAAVPWTEVIAQQHVETGARRSVHEKFIEWTGSAWSYSVAMTRG